MLVSCKRHCESDVTTPHICSESGNLLYCKRNRSFIPVRKEKIAFVHRCVQPYIRCEIKLNAIFLCFCMYFCQLAVHAEAERSESGQANARQHEVRIPRSFLIQLEYSETLLCLSASNEIITFPYENCTCIRGRFIRLEQRAFSGCYEFIRFWIKIDMCVLD